jgi:hypothetical protein
MKPITSKIHGVIDYVVGALLIAAPWLFGFADDSAATYVPVVLGAGTLLYSLMTRYELGIMKLIPFKVHLAIDAAAGVLLAASPWLFGFADYVFMPHLIVGLLELGTVAMTQRTVGDLDHRHHHREHTITH